jgi:biotin carboxylase
MRWKMDNNIVKKRLLVLGGTKSTYDLVKVANEMGVITAVTDDDPSHETRRIARENYLVSTANILALQELIREKKFDGVFCGPSEFNIRNLIKVCEATGLPCYTDMNMWNNCANKDVFKQFCTEFGVDCPRGFPVDEFSSDKELSCLDYPVIVKPVDRCSSIGIAVCEDKSSIRKACHEAMEASNCKRIIVEKYIENQGELFGVRYFLKDGEAYPYLMIDTYVADPIQRISLISAVTLAPSKHAQYYMENMDSKVRKMLKAMGLQNGTVFIQALPYKGKIYFHEMGYRLSGGLIFKMIEPLMGINDMKMMIRYALGGEMITEEEIKRLDMNFSGKCGAQLMISLSAGKISKIIGLDEALQMSGVCDFIQYYNVGDIVEDSYIGTLQQLFGRFTLVGDSKEHLKILIDKIQNGISVLDDHGKEMANMKFDMTRAR